MSFGIPAKVWLADGRVQQRGVPFTGTFGFGVMNGTETQISNATLDPASTDVTTGVLTGNGGSV